VETKIRKIGMAKTKERRKEKKRKKEEENNRSKKIDGGVENLRQERRSSKVRDRDKRTGLIKVSQVDLCLWQESQ